MFCYIVMLLTIMIIVFTLYRYKYFNKPVNIVCPTCPICSTCLDYSSISPYNLTYLGNYDDTNKMFNTKSKTSLSVKDCNKLAASNKSFLFGIQYNGSLNTAQCWYNTGKMTSIKTINTAKNPPILAIETHYRDSNGDNLGDINVNAVYLTNPSYNNVFFIS